MTDLAALLGVAVEATTRATAIIRSRAIHEVLGKGDRDMVSDIDLAVEETLREFLATETPEFGFLGEEGGASGDGTIQWVLDPVDGTANFVHGIPLCAVALGLMTEGRSIVGVIDLPFLGDRYTAASGRGAFCGERSLGGSSCERLEDALVSIGDFAVGAGAQHRNGPRLAALDLLAPVVQRIRMIGTSAISLAWAADGKVDAAVSFGNKPWDTTAGALLAREAGMTVVDLDGTPHDVRSTGTIAVAPAIADDLLALVREAVSRPVR